MLQEASKVISSAFKDSIIKKLSMYLHDCVSEEVRSSSFRNLNQDKGSKWHFLEGEEALFSNPDKPLKIKNADSRLTELMVQAEVSKKDYQLIYSYLFLKGKSSESRKKENYLTPLLYAPCRLEREGLDINCTLLDDNISLNTSALVSLMNFDEDDETADHLFEGLIDYIPEMPINEEKVKIFLNTLKAIVPEIEIVTEAQTEDLLTQQLDSLNVIDVSAIVLTKRPTVSAGLLHELSQISEKHAGVFRETALIPIQEEYTGATKNKAFAQLNEQESSQTNSFAGFGSKKIKEDKITITPLEFSDSQKQVIEAIKSNTLVTVFGPPGTGKSQTIVNLVSHLVGSGQTVLVASRMDKAVDVVSERLNSFGAHFLCLRAGKSDYQKQLSFQLENLISNKIDLDSDFESSVLTDVEDLETLFKTKNELKQNCVKILEMENKWNEVLQAYKKILDDQGDNKLINKTLSKPEIEQCKKMLDKIEKTFDKTGFLNLLNLKISTFMLNKKLDIGSSIDTEILEQLRINLQEKELKENLKGIESKINKIGNLHQILENLNDIRGKHKLTAVKILKNKRRDILKSLIREQYKRQRLMIHSKALIEKKKSLQNKVLLNEDFKPMLQAFPCWAVTTQAVSESLPLEPGLFDVAIIDEASQCDIASCFPILFRAKKAIIVGDDRQLPHLSFLEKAKEQSFLSKYNIPDKYHLMWRFRSNSLFDMTNYYSTASILLDEHFRSYPEIINFSSKSFYGGRIKPMKRKPVAESSVAPIELVIVENAKVDLDSTKNMPEAEKIMEQVHEIILNNEKEHKNPVSIGIISPFRGQVELIKKAVNQVFTGETIRKHDIEVGTAHTFQGDERDIILLSLTLAPNSHFQSIMFAQKPNLFNVAITRARKKLICFVSRPVESLPSGLIRNYLEYIQDLNKNKRAVNYEYSCPTRKEIAKLLEEEALSVVPEFETCGLKADFAVSDEINSIIVEIDGLSAEANQEKLAKSIEKQEVLERCGWRVVRISSREWNYSKKACINKIKNNLIKI